MIAITATAISSQFNPEEALRMSHRRLPSDFVANRAAAEFPIYSPPQFVQSCKQRISPHPVNVDHTSVSCPNLQSDFEEGRDEAVFTMRIYL